MTSPFEPPRPETLSRRDGERSGVPRVARRLTGAAALLVLFGCGGMPIVPGTAQAQEPTARAAASASGAFDGSLMYELMIAELAGRRGQLGIATEGYLAASARSDDPRVADRAARLAMFARRWADAETAAERWITLDDTVPEAHEMLGRARFLQGDDAGAIEAYARLVGMTSADAPLSASTGDAGVGGASVADTERGGFLRSLAATLQGDDPTRALAVIEALAAEYPREVEARLGVARLALASGEHERALEASGAALGIDPRNVDAELIRARVRLATERADEAFAGLRAALEASPGNLRLRLGHAQLLAEADRIEPALTEFETLHAAAPDDPDVQLTIGLLALDAGHPEPARRYLGALLATGEYTDQANFYLARIDDAAGEYERAIASYDAVAPGQLYPDARIRAAELSALSGQLEQGRGRLRDLAAELPDPSLQPRLLVAESRLLQNADEPAEAVEVLSDGLERFPENGDLLYARALAANGTGDTDLLERDLARLIELEPDNAHALNALGYHFVDADMRLVEAEALLEKAIALEPDDAAIIDSLGWLRYRQGRLQESIELLRRAFALFPDAEIAAHLGEVLWVLGERAEAREVWDAALDRTPDADVLQRVVNKFIN